MEDFFKIEVPVENQVHEFDARIIGTGYQHRIEVIVDGIPVFFEPDEERHYRAVVNTATRVPVPGTGRLQAIAAYLESVLRDPI